MKLNEGLRIKSDSLFKATIDEIVSYLNDEEAVKADIDNMQPDDKTIRTFNTPSRGIGYQVSIHLLLDKNPDKYNNINGVYVKGTFPPLILICLDPNKFFNEETKAEHVGTILNTLEHESTHFLQDEDEWFGGYKDPHSYIEFDTSQYQISYAAHCLGYIMYQLFNSTEFEAFQTSAANGDTIGVVNTLNEAYIVSLDIIYLFAKQLGVMNQLNFTDELENMVTNDMKMRTHDEVFGERDLDYAVNYVCELVANYYGKEFDRGDEIYFMKLFMRGMVKKYKSFMTKYKRLVKRYHPELEDKI